MTPKVSFYKPEILIWRLVQTFLSSTEKMQIKTHQKRKSTGFQMVSLQKCCMETTEQYKFYAGIDGGVK